MRYVTMIALVGCLCWLAEESWAGPQQSDQGQRAGQGSRRARLQGNGQKGQRGNRPERRRDPAQMIQRLDKDGNGSLSKAETPERMQQHFDKIDANNDGTVTAQELTNAFQNRPGQGQGKGQGQGAGQGGRQSDPAQMIQRVEKDGNGSLSKAETPERMQQRFDKIDTNGDGSITAAELTSAFQNRKAKGGPGKGKQQNQIK